MSFRSFRLFPESTLLACFPNQLWADSRVKHLKWSTLSTFKSSSLTSDIILWDSEGSPCKELSLS